MITKLGQIASDPYARRVMEEEEFMAMNIDFWKKSIVNKDSIIAAVSAERDIAWNTIAQKDKELSQRDKELEEYKRRYGHSLSLQIPTIDIKAMGFSPNWYSEPLWQ